MPRFSLGETSDKYNGAAKLTAPTAKPVNIRAKMSCIGLCASAHSIEPTKEDLLAVAAKAGLDEQEADVMFDRMATIVRQTEDVVANRMK